MDDGVKSSSKEEISNEEIFEKMFPYYLSIGMTEEQYWDKDCNLVKAYREAHELSMERRNAEMYLQGAYFYDALCRVSPLLHAFAKEGTKAEKYLEKPYDLKQKNNGHKLKKNTKLEETKLMVELMDFFKNMAKSEKR